MFADSIANQNWLYARWQMLALSLATDHAASEAAWDRLLASYTEPHRAYHNLSHIMALLQHADGECGCIHQPEVVELAIWFHDLIYDTQAHDNEQRSANLARQTMQAMRIEPSLIAAVEQCIRATHKHEVASPAVADLPLFLDLDLSILGVPEDVYLRYSQAIRAEYDWAPLPAYRKGRADILRRLMGRPVLFLTPAMAARYEAQARRNIELELRKLTSLQTG